jgi:hypothetical protein
VPFTRPAVAASLLLFTYHPAIGAPRCPFDFAKGIYEGSPVEQARCLTPEFSGPLDRRDETGGKNRLSLGSPLEELVGKSATLDKGKLRALLTQAGLPEFAAALSKPLSTDTAGRPARYFVVHDTSTPFAFKPFPADDAALMKKLGSKWKDGTWRAHAWVNRLGQARITYDYSVRLPNTAMQFERSHHELKGLYLHTEVTQPRKSATKDPRNDAWIPVPAFTDSQYSTVALLYVAASARAGTWLVPAYHVAIDWGVGDHDDPQHFDFGKFSAAIEGVRNQVAAP